jgi:hypothetical protein
MRSPRDIIRDNGGSRGLHAKLHGVIKSETIKSWSARNRVPQEYWRTLADHGVCTLDELATAAALKLQAAA